MSKGLVKVEKLGKICDICDQPILTDTYLNWRYGSKEPQEHKLDNHLYFVFKTMFGGKTGATYDAHGQCAADVLSKFIEEKKS